MSVKITQTNPNALKKIQAAMKAACEKEVAVGFPMGKAQAYPEGESVIDVAAKQCFGIGVPERNFMQLGEVYIAGDSIISDSLKLAAQEASKPNGNPQGVTAMQNAAGQQAQALIRKAIIEGNWEPNSPRTIARKGEDARPLIDTGHMLNAVTYVVRDKKK